jgi:hypothetical protein
MPPMTHSLGRAARLGNRAPSTRSSQYGSDFLASGVCGSSGRSQSRGVGPATSRVRRCEPQQTGSADSIERIGVRRSAGALAFLAQLSSWPRVAVDQSYEPPSMSSLVVRVEAGKNACYVRKVVQRNPRRGSVHASSDVVSRPYCTKLASPSIELLPRGGALGDVAVSLRERARAREGEDRRELSPIEPYPVGCADIDGDPGALAEILPQHQLAARGALAVPNGIRER